MQLFALFVFVGQLALALATGDTEQHATRYGVLPVLALRTQAISPSDVSESAANGDL